MQHVLGALRWLLVGPVAAAGWVAGFFVYRAIYLAIHSSLAPHEWARPLLEHSWLLHDWTSSFLCVLLGAMTAPKFKRLVGIGVACVNGIAIAFVYSMKLFWKWADQYSWESVGLAFLGSIAAMVLAIYLTSGPVPWRKETKP